MGWKWGRKWGGNGGQTTIFLLTERKAEMVVGPLFYFFQLAALSGRVNASSPMMPASSAMAEMASDQ